MNILVAANMDEIACGARVCPHSNVLGIGRDPVSGVFGLVVVEKKIRLQCLAGGFNRLGGEFPAHCG